MFIERRSSGNKGWIEVICGCMFSGKTEELIRRLKRAQIANQKVIVFKSAVDVRYNETDIISHDEKRLHATPIGNAHDILPLAADADVIGIDEAQFFEDDIVDVVEKLALQGSRVIIAGLDMDYMARPFGPVPALLAHAEYVTKLHAICVKCGETASYSYRNSKNDNQILLGEKDVYEPRCRSCYYDQ